MAWNIEETQRRLRDAACLEFAEHGIHGTTMDRIANRAGINKERIYNYFGNKQSLFNVVLTAELEKLATSLDLYAPDFSDVGEYAARIFDYHSEHPSLSRLMLWEGLAGGPVVNETNRTAHYQRIVASVAAAQQDGILANEFDPGKLLFSIVSLAAWWFCVPQLAKMMTGADATDPVERQQRRDGVARAAQHLAAPSNASIRKLVSPKRHL